MSPWRILFDLIGWWILVSIAFGLFYSLAGMVCQYARDLWDARGDPPEPFDCTSTMDAKRRGEPKP